MLFGGFQDGRLARWDARTGQRLPGEARTGWVRSLAVVGPVVFSGSDDGEVRRWDTRTGEPAGAPLPGRDASVCSLVAVRTPDRVLLVGGFADGALCRWDALTGQPLGEPLPAHTAPVRALAAIGTTVFSACDDGAVRRWDATTGLPTGELTGHPAPVLSLLPVRVNGRAALVAGCRTGDVLRWDTPTDTPATTTLTGHPAPVRALAAIGQTLFSGADDGTLHRQDLRTGALTGELSGHSTHVQQLATTKLPDGRVLLVTTGDTTVRRWDLTTGRSAGPALVSDARQAWAIACHGPLIVSGGQERVVRLWDARTGALMSELRGHTATITCARAFTLDNRTTIATGDQAGAIRLWDAATGGSLSELTGHTSNLTSLDTTEIDGRVILVSTSHDRTVRRWDAATGRQVGAPITGDGGIWGPAATTTLADGRVLIACGDENGALRRWDARTGAPVGDRSQGHAATHSITSVVATHVRGRPVLVTADPLGTVLTWDAETGLPLGEPISAAPVRGMTARGDADGLVIATGSPDARVTVWPADRTTPEAGEAVRALLHDLAGKFGRTTAPTWFDHAGELVVGGGHVIWETPDLTDGGFTHHLPAGRHPVHLGTTARPEDPWDPDSFRHTVDLVVIPLAEPARIAEADWDVEDYGDIHLIEDHAVLWEEEASLTAGRSTDLPALIARAREDIRARGPHLRRHNWAELLLDAETGANAFVLPVSGTNVTGYEIRDETDTLLCLVLTTIG